MHLSSELQVSCETKKQRKTNFLIFDIAEFAFYLFYFFTEAFLNWHSLLLVVFHLGKDIIMFSYRTPRMTVPGGFPTVSPLKNIQI